MGCNNIVHTIIDICYIYFDTLMLGVSHDVEVLVLCLLVVKIPYSSCIVNTVDVVACHIYSWFLPMSWVLDLSILLSICRVYRYVGLVMSSYLVGELVIYGEKD